VSAHPETTAAGRPPGQRSPDLAIIAAVASNGVIGIAGGLPWRLPDDLKRFRALTRGHAVIMGRRTWESILRPLPERQNIVLSSRDGYDAPGADVVTGLDAALAIVAMPSPAFCIGGAGLYREAIPRASTMHLTEIARPFDGDTRFPAFERADWREVGREAHVAADGCAYAFVTYARTG
jgi:dihydrofolate reductase